MKQNDDKPKPLPPASVHHEPKVADPDDDPIIAALRILAEAGRRAQGQQPQPAWKGATNESK